jgi:predicted nuclease with TOPRIM domain
VRLRSVREKADRFAKLADVKAAEAAKLRDQVEELRRETAKLDLEAKRDMAEIDRLKETIKVLPAIRRRCPGCLWRGPRRMLSRACTVGW